MAKKVAEVFIETLVLAGVKRVYGVSGDFLNGLTDTIGKNKKIGSIISRPLIAAHT